MLADIAGAYQANSSLSLWNPFLGVRPGPAFGWRAELVLDNATGPDVYAGRGTGFHADLRSVLSSRHTIHPGKPNEDLTCGPTMPSTSICSRCCQLMTASRVKRP